MNERAARFNEDWGHIYIPPNGAPSRLDGQPLTEADKEFLIQRGILPQLPKSESVAAPQALAA